MSINAPAVVADAGCRLGTGPRYHPDEGVVYWLDAPAGSLFRYDPIANCYERVFAADGPVGSITVEDDGGLALFHDGGSIQRWTPDDGATGTLDVAVDGAGRVTDAAVGPNGRVLVATVPADPASPVGRSDGSLACVDADGNSSTVEASLAGPTGLAFSGDGNCLFVAESGAQRVLEYDYDERTGVVSTPTVVVDARDDDGTPAGVALDTDGHVWTAFWNGGYLARFGFDGTETRRTEIAATKVSAVTFGGPERATGYVTTAGGPAGDDAGEPTAGALFAAELGASGVGGFRSRLGP